MKKILITGGTGLIGLEVGRRLAERGDEIVLLVRNEASIVGRLPFPAKCFRWDHTMDVPKEALEGVQAVIHLAGEPIADGRWTSKRKDLIRASRVEGTRRLVEAVLESKKSISGFGGVKVFVQGSATGIYGDRSDEVLDASSSPASGFLPDLVSDWESESLRLSGSSVRLVRVRTAMVLARHGGAIAKMLPLFRSGLGARLGFSGRQFMSWIHLDDIAGLLIHALDRENVSGVLEGASPNPVRNSDFTDVFCRELQVIQNAPVPTLALKALYGEMSAVLLESQRVTATETLKSGFKFKFETIDQALSEVLTPLRLMTFEKLTEQWVPTSVEKVWPYFTDEKNLEELTPEFLGFKVKGKSTPEIGEGTLIDYTLTLNGLPFGWRTRIEEWKPGVRFVDTQLKGPYNLWHHTHDFIPMGRGTLLRDRVFYRMPLGWLGSLAAGWKVHSDVAQIFNFRRKKIAERFGQ